MRNGVLFTNKRKRNIDLMFRSVDKLAKAVEDVRLDRDMPSTPAHGTNRVSRPTESMALRNVTDVLRVCIVTDEGKSITVDYPERWLRIFSRCCKLYADSSVMNAVKDRYVSKVSLTNNRTSYAQLDKFLSDGFILAVQNRLIKV